MKEIIKKFNDLDNDLPPDYRQNALWTLVRGYETSEHEYAMQHTANGTIYLYPFPNWLNLAMNEAENTGSRATQKTIKDALNIT